MKNEKKQNKNQKNLKVAIIAWLALAFVIFIFFMMERKTIVSNLQLFSGKIFNSKNSELSETEEQNLETTQNIEIITSENEITITEEKLNESNTTTDKKDLPENSSEITKLDDSSKTAQTDNLIAKGASENVQPENKISPTPNTQNSQQTVQKTSRIELCFVVIDSGDGSVRRKLITRDLPRSDAPLTAAINALLAGPTPAEQNLNCKSLIPSGTRLLGASVRDGIAYLNFSEEFEINTVGVEGYTAQMMQIVYTTTNFPTVNSVQFLIEGERKEYLGSEGLWIGSPLNRNSFR